MYLFCIANVGSLFWQQEISTMMNIDSLINLTETEVYLTWMFAEYIYIYAFSRRFYPKRLTLHSSYSFTFYQLLLSLGIEPMILALLAPCSTIWATGKPINIIRLPFDFMNTYKWQLIIIISFFVQLFQDHMHNFFVTGVTFFSNIKSFYEIISLFFFFFFSTRSQSCRKIMKMQEISRLCFIYLMWQTITVQ